MNDLNELYTDQDILLLESRIAKLRRTLFIIAAAALLICILFCCITHTSNEEKMLIGTIAVSTLSGWFLLYIRKFLLKAAENELAHAKMLKQSERTLCRGTVEVTDEKLRIINSITFRFVDILDGEARRRIKVIDSRSEAIKNAGKELELQLANGYVAAWRSL